MLASPRSGPDDAAEPEFADAANVTAAVFIDHSPESFLPTFRSLAGIPGLTVIAGTARGSVAQAVRPMGVPCQLVPSPAALVNELFAATDTHILLVSDAAVVPPEILDRALALVEADLRIASVSFFSNDASFLSFPYRNQPSLRLPDGHDEVSVTRTLRALSPEPVPTPIPAAAGAVVLLARSAFRSAGPLLEQGPQSISAAVTEYCQRCRERGFLDILDPGTFYALPSDLRVAPRVPVLATGLTPFDNHWANELHPNYYVTTQRELSAATAPIALAFSSARTKIQGLRVLIDGRCLGPTEMGTQVATLALIDALRTSDEVSDVSVVLPGPVPAYAEKVLAASNVKAHAVNERDLSIFGRVDVGYRPYQPDPTFDIARWREVADRVAISILDLISYRTGTYSSDAAFWFTQRDHLYDTIRQSDGVTVISHDVRLQMELERLPIGPERVFEVPLGTEHLTGSELAKVPQVLLERGLHTGPFLLCIGTNYTHKNRDLAVRAHAEMLSRGWDLALIMAGAFVPFGSSRAREAAAASDGVYVLPDVPSEERNWLLRHASVVLFPTSAEGFGLVPFEAARFGTPTVYVSFGPLAELAGHVAVTARDWSPVAIADSAEMLMRDPALAERQVEATLAAGTAYNWPRAGRLLTSMFRTLLASPPR